MTNMPDKSNHTEIILYQTEDGRTTISVRLENETVWLSQMAVAELFQTSVPNISMHLRNIFRTGELQTDSVVKEFITTAADGKRAAATVWVSAFAKGWWKPPVPEIQSTRPDPGRAILLQAI